MDDFSKITSSNVELINSLENRSGPARKLKLLIARLYKNALNRIFRVLSSKTSLSIIYILYRQWMKFSSNPAFINVSYLITEYVYIVQYYSLELFLGFLVLYPSFFLIVSLFEQSVSIFLIFFIPLLVFNIFTILIIYCYVEAHRKDEKISLFAAFLICLKQLFSISVILLLQVSINIEAILLLVLAAFSFSFFFATGWENSIYYWTFLVFCTLNVIIFPIFKYF